MISCPTPLFLLSCKLPGIKPWSTEQSFQPPWPISQTLRWKNAILTCIWNHSALQNGELSFPNGRNSISRYFFSQNQKYRFVLFQYTNLILCAKFGDLKPRIDEKRRPQAQKQHSARKLRFSFRRTSTWSDFFGTSIDSKNLPHTWSLAKRARKRKAPRYDQDNRSSSHRTCKRTGDSDAEKSRVNAR